jgi:hypothetical protein
VREALRLSLPAWLVSRATSALTLLVVWLTHRHRFPRAGSAPGAHGWWAWDAGWYRYLAVHGYVVHTGVLGGAPAPRGAAGAVRFFPLLPLLGRWIGALTGTGVALLLVANLAALAFAALATAYAAERLGRDSARLVPWFVLLAPGAVVLSIAYSEPLAGALSAGYLLALARRGPTRWLALPCGLLAGLCRPTGVLLAAVPVIAVARPQHRPRQPLLHALAAAAPVAGTAIYCAWTAHVDHDWLAAFHAQSRPGLRGGLVANPLHALFFASSHAGMPVAWRIAAVLLALGLLAVAWRRLPAGVAVWATLLVLASLTSARALSLPRYLSADFPLLLALAAVVQGRRRWAALAVALSAAGFAAVAVTGFAASSVL